MTHIQTMEEMIEQAIIICKKNNSINPMVRLFSTLTESMIPEEKDWRELVNDNQCDIDAYNLAIKDMKQKRTELLK